MFTYTYRFHFHILVSPIIFMSDSSVSIVLGYGLDSWGCRVRFLAGAGNFFLFTTMSRMALRPTKPPIQWVMSSFPVVKQPGHEADHSPPSSAEVKNAWSYTSNPQYVSMAWCLVKHRDNFTLYQIQWQCTILLSWPDHTIPVYNWCDAPLFSHSFLGICLTHVECLICGWSVTPESTLMIPSNLIYIWS
jgi:hypothetical protein